MTKAVFSTGMNKRLFLTLKFFRIFIKYIITLLLVLIGWMVLTGIGVAYYEDLIIFAMFLLVIFFLVITPIYGIFQIYMFKVHSKQGPFLDQIICEKGYLIIRNCDDRTNDFVENKIKISQIKYSQIRKGKKRGEINSLFHPFACDLNTNKIITIFFSNPINIKVLE